MSLSQPSFDTQGNRLSGTARRGFLLLGALAGLISCGGAQEPPAQPPPPAQIPPPAAAQPATTISPSTSASSSEVLTDGKQIFRYDTFGDEQFWTDTARMHEVIQKSISPKTALSVGLKVDAEAIPPDVAKAIKEGKVDLDSPATTVTLLKLNAVVGLKGTVKTENGKDTLAALGMCIVRRRYGGCGSTRRTSTMGARRRRPRW